MRARRLRISRRCEDTPRRGRRCHGVAGAAGGVARGGGAEAYGGATNDPRRFRGVRAGVNREYNWSQTGSVRVTQCQPPEPRKCLTHRGESTKIPHMAGCAEGWPERIPPSAPVENQLVRETSSNDS